MTLRRRLWAARDGLVYAWRRVARDWRSALGVMLILGLGLGSASAMFSAVDEVALRQLPFPRADRLVVLRGVAYPGPFEARYRTPMFDDLTGSHDLFSGIAAFASGATNLEDPNHAERVRVGRVTAHFFRTMEVQPALGRGFKVSDAERGSPPVVVVSYSLWQHGFAGAPILGRVIVLAGTPFTVVGIMPRGFAFPDQSDLWVPMSDPWNRRGLSMSVSRLPTILARLAGRTSLTAASARIRDLWLRDAARIPSVDSSGQLDFRRRMAAASTHGMVRSLRAELAGTVVQPAMALFAAALLLLLIGCANIANLLVAQAAMRQHEIATRAALGATQRRLVGELLAESLVLALGGTVLGLGIASALLGLVNAILPPSLTALFPPHLHVRTILFAVAVGGITTVVFGLWPAATAARRGITDYLHAHLTEASISLRSHRVPSLALVGEVGLSVLLVSAAIVVLQQFDRIAHTTTGIRSTGIGTVQVSFTPDAGPPPRRLAALRAMLGRVRAVAGVTAAGVVSDLPMDAGGSMATSTVGGHYARWLQCSGGYFRAMGIPLVRGRPFTADDDSAGPRVVVLAQALADTLWPGENAIGRVLPVGTTGAATVVGVVGDVRQGAGGPSPDYALYFPIGQWTPSYATIVARSTRPSADLLARMEAAVRTADPSQPPFNLRSMDAVLGEAVAVQRTDAQLITLFGGLALLEAALGVYGMVAYAMSRRRRDIAIRAALGASGPELMRSVATEVLQILLAGATIGVVLSWVTRHAIQPLIADAITPTWEPFLIGVAVVAVSTGIAAYVPARRAIAADPMLVLRDE